MTDEELKKFMIETIKYTVSELKREGLLRESDEAIYNDVSKILKHYYSGDCKDVQVTEALTVIRMDPYYTIIPMYFKDNQKVEVIADAMNVDVSTIVRNKKRLCLQIYKELT